MRLTPELEQKVQALVLAMGYELVSFQFAPTASGRVMQVMIDCAGGVKVGDCERVSRELDAFLLDCDLGALRYRLEVSSPGLNRPLMKAEDFSRFAGQKVQLRTKLPLAGRRNYKGVLQGMQDEAIRIAVDGELFTIPLQAVDRAHLIYEGKELKKK